MLRARDLPGRRSMAGPLSHIRVLDLSRVLAGPFAAQALADLGAEVIKIERPGEGDDTRHFAPPYLTDQDGRQTTETAYFLAANRGKKSVTIDLSRARGQELVRALAARSDVLIENFKVGGAGRFGLAYDDLKTANRGLIYCSITGFGQDGPYKDLGGYDYVIQAMGGLMSITGEPDGRPGAGPQKIGLAISDLFAGMYATTAINAALVHRERSGEGQYIDLALLDCTVSMLSMLASSFFITGISPTRMGTAHPHVVPHQLFETAEGPLVVAVGNDGQFARLCAALAMPELSRDPRFARNSGRSVNRAALIPLLAAELKKKSAHQWLAEFARAGVPAGPVNSLAQVFDDPQVRHRGLKITLPHSSAGEASHTGSPIRLSATPVGYRRSAPLLGEHTDEVLGEMLGLNHEAIAALRADGAI